MPNAGWLVPSRWALLIHPGIRFNVPMTARIPFAPSTLAHRDAGNLSVRVASLVQEEIRRGRFRGRIPSSRVLAEELAVDRETVQRAMASLVAEGWLVAKPRTGLFVAEELPSRFIASGKPIGVHARPHFALNLRRAAPLELPEERALLDLSTGVPDVRLAPLDALARAYKRALTMPRQRLGYGDVRGEKRLRRALAAMLRETRALATQEDDVLITHGSQHAIDLVARVLLKPGDRVAVEVPGYRPAWSTLEASGATLIPIAVDARGLDTSALEAALREGPIRAVYVTPHHQYPTMHVMAPERRTRLLELARLHRFAILEDDYDHEHHFEGPPVAPLAAQDRHGSVVYIGSLSKLFAPGVRIGFVAAPRALIDAVAALRFVSDRQGDHVLQAAIAELIEEGVLEQHTRRLRRHILQRRDALIVGLERLFGARMSLSLPSGGLALWPRIEGTSAWWKGIAGATQRLGLRVDVGATFAMADVSLPHLRIGFAWLDADEATRALRLLAKADGSLAPKSRRARRI